MQDRPTAAELLATIAELLEGPLLQSTQGPLRHPVRVAGNLCRILEREAELGPEQDRREIELLRSLVDGPSATSAELNEALSQALETSDDLDFQARSWAALTEIVRDKLAIAKPGHEAWTEDLGE